MKISCQNCNALGLEMPAPARFQLVALLVLLAAVPVQAVILPPIWRWSNPTPHGASVYDMVLVNDTYIQVGERGQIFTSDDAQSWVPQRQRRFAVARHPRLSVSGESGTVLLSENL